MTHTRFRNDETSNAASYWSNSEKKKYLSVLRLLHYSSSAPCLFDVFSWNSYNLLLLLICLLRSSSLERFLHTHELIRSTPSIWIHIERYQCLFPDCNSQAFLLSSHEPISFGFLIMCSLFLSFFIFLHFLSITNTNFSLSLSFSHILFLALADFQVDHCRM